MVFVDTVVHAAVVIVVVVVVAVVVVVNKLDISDVISTPTFWAGIWGRNVVVLYIFFVNGR